MTDNIQNTTVLSGHTSADTAHLSFAYPFGRKLRCVRREWIERSERGAARGQYRMVTQTTHPSFNRQYTTLLHAQGQEAADAWALQAIQDGRATWNAIKPSTYSYLVVLAQRPLGDESGRLGTSSLSLSGYSSAEYVATFKTLCAGKLDESQEKILQAIETALARAQARAAEREAAAA